VCNDACSCVSCINTQKESHVGGRRKMAIQNAVSVFLIVLSENVSSTDSHPLVSCDSWRRDRMPLLEHQKRWVPDALARTIGKWMLSMRIPEEELNSHSTQMLEKVLRLL
jgi:hypothetical protein